MITRDEFKQMIQQIGTSEKEEDRRTLLSDLNSRVSEVFDSNETLTESNNQYASDMENLRSANMKLFLQIGSNDKPADPIPQDEPPEKRSFIDLFDNKGGIK